MTTEIQAPEGGPTAGRLTDRELQSLRNMGGLAEQAADEIAADRAQASVVKESLTTQAPAEGDAAMPPLEEALKRAYYYDERGEWRDPGVDEWDRWHAVAKVAAQPQPKGLTSVCHIECDGCLDAGKCAFPGKPAEPVRYPHPDEDDAVTLWAEIHRLRAAVQGPDGYATWQEAATAERVRRVAAEKALAAAQAPAPVHEPIGVEVVGVVRPGGEDGPNVEWLLEGGLHAVAEGGEAYLLVSHEPITNDDGYGEVVRVNHED